MIDIDDAYARVLANVKAGQVVRMSLREALGRTLAEPVRTDVDYPPFDRAVMDGYAVRAADVADAPVTLRVTGQIAAGADVDVDVKIGPGEAAQINTGAPIPPGADAVVRVEETDRWSENPSSLPDGCPEGILGTARGDAVEIRKSVPAGKFITPRAEYVSAGDTVLTPGTRLTPLAIGAAATAGAHEVSVFRRPSVAILGTGNELVEIDRKPTGAQIRNSNQYLLEAMVTAVGAEPVILGTAHDDRDALRQRISLGAESDVLCITGGISMGAFDVVPEVLEALGATFHVRKMAIKPGRPTIFATLPDATPVFALPGNPASAFVGFILLVKPALAVIEGRSATGPRFIEARLDGAIGAVRDRRTFLPARASRSSDGGWVAKPVSWHGSGDAFGMATADALIMRPPHAGAANSGDTVMILPL